MLEEEYRHRDDYFISRIIRTRVTSNKLELARERERERERVRLSFLERVISLTLKRHVT